eukprot:m.856851 g.856851  ORF g.856851 m.856851 type:complete len:212 (-) comp59640_c0_seq7:4516-5151(-)
MVRWSALTLLCLAIVISTHSSVMASDECWTALTPSYTFDPFEFSLPTGTLTVTPELFRPFSPPFSRSLAGIKLAVSTIARDLITFKINLFQEDPFDLAARGEFVVFVFFSLQGFASFSCRLSFSVDLSFPWNLAQISGRQNFEFGEECVDWSRSRLGDPATKRRPSGSFSREFNYLPHVSRGRSVPQRIERDHGPADPDSVGRVPPRRTPE